MATIRFYRRLLLLSVLALAGFGAPPACAQFAVIDPTNLIQNALTAARTLEQINNQVEQISHQVRSLENEALNLRRLGRSVAPDLIARLEEMDALLGEASGVALGLEETRAALAQIYTGQYAQSDAAQRAAAATSQIDAARLALHRSLLIQGETLDQIRRDRTTLAELAEASMTSTGALSAQQATNELLGFQAEQTMRLQTLLAAQSRAEAMQSARELEALGAARARHRHFFAGASEAHPGQRPWN